MIYIQSLLYILIRLLCVSLIQHNNSYMTQLNHLFIAMLCFQMEADVEGLTAFRDCLLNPTLGLTTVDLLYNRIGSVCV